MISIPDVVIVASFLAATLVVGLSGNGAARGAGAGDAGYLLGGRALSLPAFVATTVSTWYGGILGVGEYSWRYGISNWLVFGVPYYVGALLFAILYAGRAREGRSMTLPHLIGGVYGPMAGRVAGLLVFATSIPGAYMLILGILVSYVFGLPVIVGILFGAAFVVAYLWRGGFGAVARTDGVQIVLMFGGFALLTGVLLVGWGLEPLSSLPEHHLSPTGGVGVGAILVWYLIALSTLAEPNFFQRCFAAKSPAVARKGLFISILCWCVFDAMTTLCGLYARALLPELSEPLYAFPSLAAAVLPAGLLGIFLAGLLATVLSTLDSNLFTAATTIGYDLWPSRGVGSADIKFRTRAGLIVAAVLSCVIAASSGTVVGIWKVFGSVSAASMMIPIVSVYYPRFASTGFWTVLGMISGALVTCGWFVAGKLWGASPFCGIEPLFVGLLASASFHCAGMVALRRTGTGGE